MLLNPETTFTIGKYLVSPLTRSDHAAGPYQAAVSIRSGHGREMHDRVYRFRPVFHSRTSALRYAAREGALLAQQRLTPLSPSPQP